MHFALSFGELFNCATSCHNNCVDVWNSVEDLNRIYDELFQPNRKKDGTANTQACLLDLTSGCYRASKENKKRDYEAQEILVRKENDPVSLSKLQSAKTETDEIKREALKQRQRIINKIQEAENQFAKEWETVRGFQSAGYYGKAKQYAEEVYSCLKKFRSLPCIGDVAMFQEHRFNPKFGSTPEDNGVPDDLVPLISRIAGLKARRERKI